MKCGGLHHVLQRRGDDFEEQHRQAAGELVLGGVGASHIRREGSEVPLTDKEYERRRPVHHF